MTESSKSQQILYLSPLPEYWDAYAKIVSDYMEQKSTRCISVKTGTFTDTGFFISSLVEDMYVQTFDDSGLDLLFGKFVSSSSSGNVRVFDSGVRAVAVSSTTSLNGMTTEFLRAYSVLPRSSTSLKYELILGNCEGLVDRGYRGQILCIWSRLGGNWGSGIPDSMVRTAQIVSGNRQPWNKVILLSKEDFDAKFAASDRNGGLGSTG